MRKRYVVGGIILAGISAYWMMRSAPHQTPVIGASQVSEKVVASSNKTAESEHTTRQVRDERSKTTSLPPCRTKTLIDASTPDVETQGSLIAFRHLMLTNGAEQSDIDRVFFEAGLPVSLSRKVAAGFPEFPEDPFHNIDQYQDAVDPSLMLEILTALETKDVDGLQALIDSGQLKPNSTIMSKSLLNSALTMKTDGAFISALIAMGVKPTFRDLVDATRSGLSVNDMALLLDNIRQDTRRTWQAHYQRQSLATLAVEALDPELLNFWMQRQSPLAPDAPYSNALDHIRQPKGEDGSQRAMSIATMLLDAGLRPLSEQTREALLRWIPAEMAARYASQLTVDTPFLSPELKDWAQILNQSVLNEEDIECIDGESEAPPLAPQGSASSTSEQSKPMTAETTAEQRATSRMYKAAMQKQWKVAEDIALTLPNSSDDQRSLAQLLSLYIANNAPFAYIESILAQQIELPPNTIIVLAHTDNIALLKKLVPYGLNIRYQNDRGLGGLAQSILSDAPRVFDYLLKENVSIRSLFMNEDLLSIAIKHVHLQKNMGYYCLKLVEHGLTVNTRHQQIARRLKQHHVEAYEALIRQIPDLQTSTSERR